MTEPEEQSGTAADDADALPRSYEALLRQESWSLDVNESLEETHETLSQNEAPVPPSLERILEALFFVGGRPLTPDSAAGAVRGVTPNQFHEAVASLNRQYRRQGRPYSIALSSDGYILSLRPRFRNVVERLYGQAREARLSTAAVDVLALVAYRQPVSKQEVDSLRGAESGTLLRQLVRRGLVCVSQRGEAGRRDVSYGTTSRFLELFKLTGLDDLPQTQDLQKL
jgi:segregation and condensation protein B